MDIGRMIFFDKITGAVIQDTFEWSNVPQKKTVEQQIKTYLLLTERNRETFDYIELEYGQYASDFAEASGYRVNPETKTLEFSYPDPNQPDAPPVYVQPLTEQIAEKDDQIEELKALVTQVSEDLAAFMDYQLSKEENGGV